MRYLRLVDHPASTLLGLGLMTLAAACGSAQYPTSGFNPTHVSTLSGRALAQDGTPLDSVQIGVTLPRGGAGYDYEVIYPRTDHQGNFSYPVRRMTAPLQVPSPDTVRAEVHAVLQKKRFATSTGAAPVLQETVLLTFVPFGQTPPVSRVEFRFAVP